jgi:hypothetical protein
MANLKYGSVEFYAEHFGDMLADVDGDDPTITDNIIKGFFTAVDDWFNYHEQQANAYAQLRQRVREALAM